MIRPLSIPRRPRSADCRMVRPTADPKCDERCVLFDAPEDGNYGICTYGGFFADGLADWWVKRDAECMDPDMYERKRK